MSDRVTQLRLEDAVTSTQDVLTPDPLIVRLNKVFSWQQSASRWPYYLSRAEPGRAYTRDELVSAVFGLAERKYRRTEPELRGWLGSIYSFRVDREHSEVIIEGLGLFEREVQAPDRFHITNDGLALAHAYSDDRISANWRRVFAGILARNDVRLRCVLLHLSRWNHLLVFRGTSSEDAFFARGKEPVLHDAEGNEHVLYGYTKGGTPAYTFTPLLQREPFATLGPFVGKRIERAGVQVPLHVCFAGGREPMGKVNHEPSGNDLRDYMKQALALFRDIGALVYVPHRKGWTLDRERCAALFEAELVSDLFGGAPQHRFLDALRAVYMKYSDAEGLVHVATIRDAVCDELDIPPGERTDFFNQQVAYYLRPDVARLGIGRTFHAQAGPEDCLFGNLNQEYVEFRFVE